MRLQSTFEPARGQILNHDPVPSFDIVVSIVISEETWMWSQSTSYSSTPETVLAAHQPPPASHSATTSSTSHAPRAPTAPPAQADTSSVFCRYCKQHRHIDNQCPKFQHQQQCAPAPQLPLHTASTETSATKSSSGLAAQVAQLTEHMQVMQRALQPGISSVVCCCWYDFLLMDIRL